MIDATDRGVSSTVTYTLVIVLTVTLTAGLVIGADELVAGQREQTVQNQLDVIGQRLASSIQTVDQMAATDPSTASVTRHFPNRVAGSQYRVIIRQPDPTRQEYVLILESTDADVTTRASVTTTVRMAADRSLLPSGQTERRIDGGSLRIVYQSGGPNLVVQDA